MDHPKYQREYAEETGDSFTEGDKKLIPRLLGYLKPHWKLLAFAVFMLLISKMIEASVPFFIGRLTQKILDSRGIESLNRAEMLHTVMDSGFFILGLLACCYFLDCVTAAIKGWIGQNGLYRLRMEVYHHIIHMPLANFDRNSVGRLMTRTIHDVDQINQVFVDSVIPIIGNLFLFAGILIALSIMDWRILVLVLFILPFVWWLTHRFRTFQSRCFDRTKTVASAMNTFLQEHLMGASIIRNFGIQSQARKQFEEINEDYCTAHLASIHQFSFFIAGIEFIQNASLVLAFATLVIFSPFGLEFDAGTYLSFSLYSLMFFRPLADLAERYNTLQSAISCASRIFNLLDRKTECLNLETAVPDNKVMQDFELESLSRGVDHSQKVKAAPIERDYGSKDCVNLLSSTAVSRLNDPGKIELSEIESLSFEDVWFGYEDQNWVLKGLSMKIHKGRSYAVVGLTGEGKTTIVNLLLRFYEPLKGKILVNGLDIRSYTLRSLRQQFGLVLQDPVIFSGTLAENISLFDQSIKREHIEKMVDDLKIGSFIKNFSEGLDHRLHGQGKGLSAGEMQLISLVRAVSHRRSVLVLDEPTAYVDTITEKMIQQALYAVLNLETAIVIAHRLSTIQNVDHIHVLQEGKIVETGNHQSLLKKKGVYEKLYRLQFSN